MDRTGIFISYSHSDVAWLSRLVDHLAVLERADLVQTWSDLKIDLGTRWRDEIEVALTRSKVAILLLSPAFFTSRFIWESEMPLIQAHQETGMQVLPIIVRPCAWRLKTSIAELQAVPSNDRALALLGEAEADAALASIIYAVADIVGRISDRGPLAEQIEAASDDADVQRRLVVRDSSPEVPRPLTAPAAIWEYGKTAVLCPVHLDDRDLIASTRAGGSFEIWDPLTGNTCRVLHADGPVLALAATVSTGQSVLAWADADGSVRTWNVDAEKSALALVNHEAAALSVCTVDVGPSELLVVGYKDGQVWLRNLITGGRSAPIDRLDGPVRSICTVRVDGQDRLAYAGDAGRLMVWNSTEPTVGSQIFDQRDGPVHALCAVPVEGRNMLVSGGDDGVVKIIDLRDATAEPLWLDAHNGPVRAACPVQAEGRELLATAGTDGFVRLWAPKDKRLESQIPVNAPALAMAPSGRHLVVGTDTGVVALELLGS